MGIHKKWLFNSSNVFFLILCLFVFIIGYLVIWGKGPFADEHLYFKLIAGVAKGNLSLSSFAQSGSFPGYFLTIGGLAYLFNIHFFEGFRLISVGFSFLSIILFALIARKVSSKDWKIKTMQYLFFPLIFPFFFLLYTDVLAICSLLLTYLYILKKKPLLSLIFASYSVFIRQDSLIWLFFFSLLQFDRSILSKKQATSRKTIILNNLFFLIPAGSMLLFFLLHKSFFLSGDNSRHPLSLHLGNIYLLLFLYFFFFFIQNLLNLPKTLKFLKLNYWWIAITLSTVILFFFFKVDHPWNSNLTRNYFLRNIILSFMTNSLQGQFFALVIICFSLLSLFNTSFIYRKYYLLYPFSFIFLSLHWLVDPRYLLVPFVLYILFKQEPYSAEQKITLMTFYFLSLILYGCLISGLFFL